MGRHHHLPSLRIPTRHHTFKIKTSHPKHHQSIGEASKKAYRTVGKDVVKPFWSDLVKPTVKAVDAIPTQAFSTANNTINLFQNPLFLILAGFVAFKVLK